jgi:hypothetical protein
MERLPYIDEHAITVAASRAETWPAVLHIICRDRENPPTVPIGFVLDEVRPPDRFALKGRHLFARYKWVFELDAEAPQRTCVRSATWAHFPGLHGKIYRALVIGTGAHRVVVRWTLKRIAARALAARTHIVEDAADYADVFEVPIRPADSRTAEQAIRDGFGPSPGISGAAVFWIHRHVLGFRLGPPSSPEHVFGWSIVRSDDDNLVLEANGRLMHGELHLRRHYDRRAVLTTRLHFRRKFTARVVWTMIGPLHRAIAPGLMKRTVRVSV